MHVGLHWTWFGQNLSTVAECLTSMLMLMLMMTHWLTFDDAISHLLLTHAVMKTLCEYGVIIVLRSDGIVVSFFMLSSRYG